MHNLSEHVISNKPIKCHIKNGSAYQKAFNFRPAWSEDEPSQPKNVIRKRLKAFEKGQYHSKVWNQQDFFERNEYCTFIQQ